MPGRRHLPSGNPKHISAATKKRLEKSPPTALISLFSKLLAEKLFFYTLKSILPAGLVTIPQNTVAVILTCFPLLLCLDVAEHVVAGGAAAAVNRQALLPADLLLFRREIGHIRHPIMGTTHYHDEQYSYYIKMGSHKSSFFTSASLYPLYICTNLIRYPLYLTE
jgi:hypothetical protein